jgi:hypothetical protein
VTPYDLVTGVHQHLHTILSYSEWPALPPVPLSDSSSIDADTGDDLSVPSPASMHKYSILVAYSSEIPSYDVALLPLANSELTKGSLDKLAPLCGLCIHILPMLGPLPVLFSLHIVTLYCVSLWANRLNNPLLVCYHKKLYRWMWKDLLHPKSYIMGKQIKYVCLSPFRVHIGVGTRDSGGGMTSMGSVADIVQLPDAEISTDNAAS